MLYPTHQPFFFPFNPFTTPILSPSPTTLPSPIPVEPSMECVEADLKPSFGQPKKAQPRPQAFSDNSPEAVNGVSGDEFFVDDLFDFSKEGAEEGFFGIKEEEDQDPDNTTKSCSVSISLQEQKQSNKTSFDFGCSELSVPAEDAASLEWLSHFVEDSFSNYSVPFPSGKSPEKLVENGSEPVQAKPCFATPGQTKARSKRSRTGFRVWSLGSTSESSTSSSSTTSSDSLLRPPRPEAKKQKRRKGETGGGGGGSQQPRRCSHCFVQKTPQWRAGPLGAKTLCNACGVRFKSGRLLPEYRPACSPTFSSDVHSNSHRKVMEMRRQKESDPGSDQPVQSF